MNTSSFPRLIALTVGLIVLPMAVQALPVDLSIPSGGLGPTRTDGAAVHWLELGDFDFGGGLALPLRLSFDSDRVSGPGDFGDTSKWWRSPVLHSRIMTNNDRQLVLMLPCGKVLTLEKSKDPQLMATMDGEWQGKLVDQVLTLSRADGWELEFSNGGWLMRLRTDGGRTLLWERGQSGRLISIYEQLPAGRGVTGLSIQRDPSTGAVVGMIAHTPLGTRIHQMAYDAQHRLTKVTLHDGTTEAYAYVADNAGHPQLTLTDRSLVKSTLTWDQTTHKLLSDGIWTYQIETKYATSYPCFTRRGPGGETESYLDDSGKTGVIAFTAADGTTTARQLAMSGPGRGQLERVSRTNAGSNKTVQLYQATFDAKGNLATETDALGRVTKHDYSLWGGSKHTGVKTHTKTDPLGAQTVENYDPHGNLIAVTNALGHKTMFEYDDQNRRVKTTGPDGAVIEALTYNTQGQVESRTDAAGAKTTFGYDKNGNRITVTNALGHVTKDAFDARGNRIASSDALGYTWRYEYDLGNRLVKTFAPTAQPGIGNQAPETPIETRSYNAQGKLATITDTDGNVQRTEYDKFGRVTARTDALDRTTRYSYEVTKGAVGCTSCNASAMPTLITMPSGRKIQRVYDADKHLIEETTAFGSKDAATTKHDYDLVGNEIKTIDPLGRVTQYQYDAANRRVAMIFPDSSQRSYAYDAAGQLIAQTDELGHTTKLKHDTYGNVVAQTDPAGNVTTTLFDTPGSAALHRPTGTKSAAGVIKRTKYDLLGHRIAQSTESRIENQESRITHEFDAAGNEIKTIHPGGKTLDHSYDERNRRVSTTDNLGRVWKYSYAASTSNVGAPPCCGADPINNARAVEITHPDGTKELRLTNAAGQLIETKDAKGDSVKYGYDPDGRLTTLTDANNHVTRWTYDPRGKLESKVYPDKTMELYEHDLASQLITRTRPDGTAAVNTYDARGRLLSTVWKDDKAEAAHYEYDQAGHLTKAVNASAEIVRRYTPSGKIASEAQKITASFAEGSPRATENGRQETPTYAVGYDYDADGRLAKITYPDGTAIGYNYNDKGELAEVTEAQPGIRNLKPVTVASYTRNPDGQVTELKMDNGVTTTKHYDAVGRLSEIAHQGKDGTVLFAEASRYDQRDRRTARIKGDGTADLFAYDPAGQVIAAAYGQAFDQSKPLQLLQDPNAAPDKSGIKNQESASASQQLFAYDPAGNRKQFQDLDGSKTAYQTNESNQYTAISSEKGETQSTISDLPSPAQPAYDPNGNLLKDPHNTYTWDADIHLLSVTTKLHQPEPGTVNRELRTQFRYDPLHRRVARIEPEGKVTHFIHDGWNVIAEYEGSGKGQVKSQKSEPHPSSFRLHTSLTWGEDVSRTLQGAGGIGGLLATHTLTLNSQPTTLNFSYDSNGNVVLLTAPDATISARYGYDAFGKTIIAIGKAAESNRYRFSTKLIESGSGLAFYGFRYYSPELGRWTARDPIAERGGNNLFGMVLNQPVNHLDFLGLACANNIPCTQQWRYRCCGDQWHSLFPPGFAPPEGTSLNYDPSTDQWPRGTCCGDQWISVQSTGCCRNNSWVEKKRARYLILGYQTYSKCIEGVTSSLYGPWGPAFDAAGMYSATEIGEALGAAGFSWDLGSLIGAITECAGEVDMCDQN